MADEEVFPSLLFVNKTSKTIHQKNDRSAIDKFIQSERKANKSSRYVQVQRSRRIKQPIESQVLSWRPGQYLKPASKVHGKDPGAVIRKPQGDGKDLWGLTRKPQGDGKDLG